MQNIGEIVGLIVVTTICTLNVKSYHASFLLVSPERIWLDVLKKRISCNFRFGYIRKMFGIIS